MKTLLISNLRLKLLALIFSLALWFFVAGQSNTEVGFLVPIGLKSIPKDMVMTSMPPDEIEVRVTGPKLFINNISPGQINAELDLSGAKEGLNSYRILPKDIVTPMGVDVLRLRPSSIELRLEKLILVELPIKVRLSGKPAQGYRVADVIVFPKTVVASGTRKEIRELRSVYTKPVDVTGLDSPESVTVPLDTAGYEFRSTGFDRAEVKIIIKKER